MFKGRISETEVWHVSRETQILEGKASSQFPRLTSILTEESFDFGVFVE